METEYKTEKGTINAPTGNSKDGDAQKGMLCTKSSGGQKNMPPNTCKAYNLCCSIEVKPILALVVYDRLNHYH